MIKTRTCATCASYNPSPSADEPLCWNLVTFEHADVAAGCPEHITPEEDAVEVAIYLQRSGYIEASTGTDPRNPKYMKYCLQPKNKLDSQL